MSVPECPGPPPPEGRPISRRCVLAGGGLALGGAGYALVRRAAPPSRDGRPRPGVFIAAGQRYGEGLARTVRDGLLATGFDPLACAGKRVLLKPNLVEPSRAAPPLTTHPSVLAAAAEVFLGWGARVLVGEGSGHVRDTELILAESGLDDALAAHRLAFVDLNYEDTARVRNAGGASALAGFHLPRAVAGADLIVSLPKLKTHHWIGMTASLKNLYGVLPGVVYGWPKNVLHRAGIPETVFDLAATLPRTIAVVDAIDCMEGDGPIMGTRKPLGLIVVGTVPAAVDATCARIMGLVPARIPYLDLASRRWGPLGERDIDDRGERWRSVASPFRILDFPHLQRLRAPFPPHLPAESG